MLSGSVPLAKSCVHGEKICKHRRLLRMLLRGWVLLPRSREMLRKVSHKVEDIRMNTFSVSITELNLVLVSDDGNPLIGL